MRRVKLPSGEIRRFARHTGSLGKLKRYGKIAQDFYARGIKMTRAKSLASNVVSNSDDQNQYSSALFELIVNIDAGCGA